MTVSIGVIPARKGSKGLPGKNKKLFSGKPLLQWSVDQAYESGCFDAIVVSSDDSEILKMAEGWGEKKVIPVERHPELATDEASINDVLYDLFARPDFKCDYVCLLNPTSPLRSVDDIRATYKLIQDEDIWTVITVKWCDYIGWVEKFSNKGPMCSYNIQKRPNRQTRNDFFLENGAIYWVKHEILIAYGNLIGDPKRVKLYEMPMERSLEIDTPFDFYMAEKAYEYTSMGIDDEGLQQVLRQPGRSKKGMEQKHDCQSSPVQ